LLFELLFVVFIDFVAGDAATDGAEDGVVVRHVARDCAGRTA
jgi:hypothetical protein